MHPSDPSRDAIARCQAAAFIDVLEALTAGLVQRIEELDDAASAPRAGQRQRLIDEAKQHRADLTETRLYIAARQRHYKLNSLPH